MRVRVVDISATGALLATETLPGIGTTALLKSALGAATFACEVQVRRTGSTSGAPAVGVSFSAIDDRNRRNLDQFLKKASA
jgi:c-di-GMP-binding flagellar brake protein YcgR